MPVKPLARTAGCDYTPHPMPKPAHRRAMSILALLAVGSCAAPSGGSSSGGRASGVPCPVRLGVAAPVLRAGAAVAVRVSSSCTVPEELVWTLEAPAQPPVHTGTWVAGEGASALDARVVLAPGWVGLDLSVHVRTVGGEQRASQPLGTVLPAPALANVQARAAADGSNCVVVDADVSALGSAWTVVLDPAAGDGNPGTLGPRATPWQVRVAPSSAGRVVQDATVVVTPRVGGLMGEPVALPVTLNADTSLARWQAQTPRVVGAQPSGVAVADLDADGVPETLVSSHGNDRVVLLASNDAQVPVTLDTGKGPEMVLAVDLDADADADGVVCNHDSNTVSVLRNRQGLLVVEEPVDVGINPYAVAVGDVDGDGYRDVVAVLETDGVLTVARGDAQGRLTVDPAWTQPVGFRPHAVELADLDADGRLDAVVANSADGTVTVLMNRMGTLVAHLTLDRPVNPESVALGDINADGTPDLLVATFGGLSVSLGDGQGGFVAEELLPTGSRPTHVLLADLNLDGWWDAVVTNQGGDSVTVLRNDGGALRKVVDLPVPEEPRRTAAADVNADGLPDLVVASAAAGAVTVLLNQGTRPCRPVGAGITTVPLRQKANAVVVLTPDGDGRPQVVLSADDEASLQVHRWEDGRWARGPDVMLPAAPGPHRWARGVGADGVWSVLLERARTVDVVSALRPWTAEARPEATGAHAFNNAWDGAEARALRMGNRVEIHLAGRDEPTLVDLPAEARNAVWVRLVPVPPWDDPVVLFPSAEGLALSCGAVVPTDAPVVEAEAHTRDAFGVVTLVVLLASGSLERVELLTPGAGSACSVASVTRVAGGVVDMERTADALWWVTASSVGRLAWDSVTPVERVLPEVARALSTGDLSGDGRTDAAVLGAVSLMVVNGRHLLE